MTSTGRDRRTRIVAGGVAIGDVVKQGDRWIQIVKSRAMLFADLTRAVVRDRGVGERGLYRGRDRAFGRSRVVYLCRFVPIDGLVTSSLRIRPTAA